MYAALPFTVALTPSNCVGIVSPPAPKSDACQIRESPGAARFDPLISPQVFGAIRCASPSAFATRLIAGAGAGFEHVDGGGDVVCPAIANRSRLARAYRSWSDVFARKGLTVAGHGVACAYSRSLNGTSRYWIGAVPTVPP